MFFSAIYSNKIIEIDTERFIQINTELVREAFRDCETGTRIHLDIPLLNLSPKSPKEENFPLSNVSLGTGTNPVFPAFVYITDALLSAKFRPIGSSTFIRRYLLPLDRQIKRADIRDSHLRPSFGIPRQEVIWSEVIIHSYFNAKISPAIQSLYRDINTSGRFNLVKFYAPLSDSLVVERDVAHIWGCKKDHGFSYPELCFAIGNYRKQSYRLQKGFEGMMELTQNYHPNPADTKQRFFPSRDWTSTVFFTLLLRKYLYQAFMCGTNRIFLSDNNTFSRFFEYHFDNNGIMTIEYYIIDDQQTIAEGITLRSAMAGFFFNTPLLQQENYEAH
ncbi:uncharacterized protein RJT20DRAFT_148276 [Scheffersomyces xylosifermentans]|uniref:uncharacterized protein n=1 Tax=Scheffersomyces xylosifermentans TaxID=1304137 RepID=UPI00315D1269